MDELRAALANQRSGLRANDFPGCDLPTWIGRVAAIDEYVFSPALAQWQSRNNALIALGLQQGSLQQSLAKLVERFGSARIGVVIGDAELVAVLQRCQAPYPVPTPCADLALEGLSDAALAQTRERVATVRRERERLQYALARVPGVRRVYPSQGNYLLARFDDAEGAFRALLSAGVVVRDQRAAPQLGDALRITIGSPAQNDRVIAALNAQEQAA